MLTPTSTRTVNLNQPIFMKLQVLIQTNDVFTQNILILGHKPLSFTSRSNPDELTEQLTSIAIKIHPP